MEKQQILDFIDVVRCNVTKIPDAFTIEVRTDSDGYDFEIEDVRVLDIEAVFDDVYLVIGTTDDVEIGKSVRYYKEWEFRIKDIERIAIAIDYGFGKTLKQLRSEEE